ncbi:MAG: hypothetical protein HY390_08230 [Deltaproteobacteria bacterium]|nr:hypothetical protein [Deltaproteobacteria bacterium]
MFKKIMYLGFIFFSALSYADENQQSSPFDFQVDKAWCMVNATIIGNETNLFEVEDLEFKDNISLERKQNSQGEPFYIGTVSWTLKNNDQLLVDIVHSPTDEKLEHSKLYLNARLQSSDAKGNVHILANHSSSEFAQKTGSVIDLTDSIGVILNTKVVETVLNASENKNSSIYDIDRNLKDVVKHGLLQKGTTYSINYLTCGMKENGDLFERAREKAKSEGPSLDKQD